MLALVWSGPFAQGYALNGYRWPAGRDIVVHLQLNRAPALFTDGSTSWNASAANALAFWNRHLAQVRFVSDEIGTPARGDGMNSAFFASNVYGQSFGANVVAITTSSYQNGVFLEADVVFNSLSNFDSYRGPLLWTGSRYIWDFHRIALHEFGHVLGLTHPDSQGQSVTAIMNSIVSDLDHLETDDADGAAALYGRPASTTPPRSLLNVSTRLRTQPGENTLIGGFIIAGNQPKQILLRALGPSLPAVDYLADPVLQLRDASGALLLENNDWNSNRAAVLATSLPPDGDREAAIVATLAPGSYTATVLGHGDSSGLALVELYDLTPATGRLANLSTRGRVDGGDNVMIGGFIVSGDQPTRVIVRAVGPSLRQSGVASALTDTTLSLHNANGSQLAMNDDWQSEQAAEIIASAVPPSDPLESAIVRTLSPGNYTAIVRGHGGSTGVALVEIYNLETN